MKKVTRYEAIDGKEFDNEDECLDHDLLINKVNTIMAALPKQPDDGTCNFSNGSGYVQHDKATLRRTQVKILELCKKRIDHQWIQQTIDDETVDPSWVARLLGDYNIRPLSYAWSRFSCIDKQHREWGQPYFAANPEKGTQVCVG